MWIVLTHCYVVIPPATKLGGILDSPCLSVCLSVCISSRSFSLDLENRVRSVASTVLDGFFLYLAQMITIIRECIARYVFFRIWKFKFLANFLNFSALTLKKKSTVLNGFLPYLAQMITSMRRCAAINDL